MIRGHSRLEASVLVVDPALAPSAHPEHPSNACEPSAVARALVLIWMRIQTQQPLVAPEE